jgi:DNA-binding transcriptional LysR family regulator
MASNNHSGRPDLAALDLNKLRTFAAIAEHGGVTAAARHLHLTRSAVSHSLASLEASLGVQLFLRVGRGLVLTEEGRGLVRAWQEVAERLSGVVEELAAGQRAVRGPVHLGLYLGFSRLRMAGVIQRFVAEHPEATVRLVYQSQSDLVDLLLAGRIDMSLSLRPGRDDSSQLASVKLFEQTLVLAARSRPRARRVDFAALCELPVIDYFRSEPLIDRWVAHHYPGERFPRERVRVWAASTDLALELALRGVGACVLPEDLVDPHRRRGDLVVLRGSGRALRDSVWLNGVPGRGGGLVKQKLREALVEGLG